MNQQYITKKISNFPEFYSLFTFVGNIEKRRIINSKQKGKLSLGSSATSYSYLRLNKNSSSSK